MEFAKSTVNWGSVPDWIAGVGSVLAFFGFAFGFWWEVRQRRLDEKDAARRQARLIVSNTDDDYATDATVRITNASHEAVFDVSVDRGATPAFTNIGFGDVAEVDIHAGDTASFVHHDPRPVVQFVGGDWLDDLANAPARTRKDVVIRFTDARGRRWQRTNRGEPVQLFPRQVP